MIKPLFDGKTFDPALDGERLQTQFEKVFSIMSDGTWHTLPELKDKVGGSEAAISARLRDFRKVKFGHHTVERRRRSVGLWEYRLELVKVDEKGQLIAF